MVPVRTEQPHLDQKPALTMDKVEMVLQLADLPKSTTAKDQELTLELPFYPTDFKSEFYSAASMVLDREEIEALEKKLPSFRLEPPASVLFSTLIPSEPLLQARELKFEAGKGRASGMAWRRT